MDPPATFDFPFEPYPIQQHFMKKLYSTLNKDKLGLFESPTGTGKSLSICCGAITWLKDYEASIITELENRVKQLKICIENIKVDGDWLQEEHEKILKNIEVNKLNKQLDSIRKRNAKLNNLKSGKLLKQLLAGNGEEKFWKAKDFTLKINKSDAINSCENPDELNEKQENDDLIIMEDEEHETDDSETEKSEEDSDANNHVQIYYGSRTHSQLSQFLAEVKRSSHSDIRAVTLASRRHYCINPDVQKLKNPHLMDERCMELRKTKQSNATLKDENDKVIKKQKNKTTSCPYYNQSGIETLRDIALGEISDIEELSNIGKLAKGCPYYAVRAASKDAQLVLLPHTSALSNLEISKETVLILDEAHNLGGALASTYTASVPLPTLTNGKVALSAYISRYKDKFAPKTLLKLNQIFFIVTKLIDVFKKKSEQETEIYNQLDFIIKAQIDHLNISPLVKFCYDTKLSQKLHWFCIKHKSSEQTKPVEKNTTDRLKFFLETMSKTSTKKENITENRVETAVVENVSNENALYSGSPIYTLLRFLDLISTSSEDGRICVRHDINPCLKYLLLDPTKRFSPIVQTAKSVVLTGGTMQPDWEFSRLLLSGGDSEDRINKVSCDHMVDPEHVKPIILHSGPGGKKLRLTHATRNDTDTLNEVGRVIQNLCRIVPGGIICFLSSYGYEEIFYNHLQKCGILTQITKLKAVFREPKESKDIDKLLDNYNKAIKGYTQIKDGSICKSGALLFSVVGGKLSEGLNFSDDLGRCVVVVGLPYGDMRSIEEKARWEYLEVHVGKGAGNANYQANCMKQVNQCIGRAVRHANDWAAMVLLDERYSQQSVLNQLPTWIKKSLEDHEKFAPAYGSLARFYKKNNRK